MTGDEWVELSEDMVDSLCCVAVRINGEMKEAKLLGFTDKVTAKKVLLSELRPIYELPEYLRRISEWQGVSDEDDTSENFTSSHSS